MWPSPLSLSLYNSFKEYQRCKQKLDIYEATASGIKLEVSKCTSYMDICMFHGDSIQILKMNINIDTNIF